MGNTLAGWAKLRTHHFPIGSEAGSRAKVHQLDVARASDEDVLWLDVAVEEAKLVQVIETHGYLREIEPAGKNGEHRVKVPLQGNIRNQFLAKIQRRFGQVSSRTHSSSLEGATKLKFAPFCSSWRALSDDVMFC